MNEMKPDKRERVVFLDYLRFFACFMVMAVHSCEPFYLGGSEPNITFIANRWDMLWITVNECLCRVCVPLFVIASSYLLFPVRGGTGAFFKRRCWRIVVPFAIWSVLYVAYFGKGSGAWGKLLFNFPDEGGHLWFVPMLLGLYVLMPLLSPWAERVGRKELQGWIALWLVTTTFPFLRVMWRVLYGEPSFGVMPYLWGECPWNAFGTFHYVSGFIGYVLLGLWFRRFSPVCGWTKTLKAAVPLWCAGIALVGIPFYSFVDKFPYEAPYSAAVEMERSIEYCSLGVALATIAMFMIFRKIDFKGRFYDIAIRPVSEASYGMYLLHMFILPVVFAFLRPNMATPLTIVSTAAATFLASAVVAVPLRKLPIVGKLFLG